MSNTRAAASRSVVGSRTARLVDAAARRVVDGSLDAVFVFDPLDLRLIYVNGGGGELLGSDSATLEGTSILDLLTDYDGSDLRATILTLTDGARASSTYVGRLLRSDGGSLPIDARLELVELPDGGSTVVMTARDIGERLDIQARLARIAREERRKAAELRVLLETIGEGVLVVGPDGEVGLANDAVADILGATPRDVAELAEGLGLADEAVMDLGSPGEPRVVNLKDDRWIEVSAYAAELATDPPDQPAQPSTIVVLRDVTGEREAERAREAFVGVLSHELRTPVTTIFGYAKVLRRSAHQRERGQMLADIEIEADRLYRIVEDLLALNRVEGGIATVEGEPLLLQHLVGPVVESEALRWNDVSFETELVPGLPAVFGERTYVEQVLRNLLSNAGKYSPAGSTVQIAAELDGDEVVVRVLDRGTGFDASEADHLFELYYRSPLNAERATGAGIGLYVCRGLLAAMGGRIWAKPRPGGGSEFGFSLTRYEEDDVIGQSGQASGFPGGMLLPFG